MTAHVAFTDKIIKIRCWWQHLCPF